MMENVFVSGSCFRNERSSRRLTHDSTWIVCVQRSMETRLSLMTNTVVVLIERIQINSMEQGHAVAAIANNENNDRASVCFLSVVLQTG